jgi:hypothetical protein
MLLLRLNYKEYPVQYQQNNRLSPPIMNTKNTTICGVCYSDSGFGDATHVEGLKRVVGSHPS